jgi:hypothetical protein
MHDIEAINGGGASPSVVDADIRFRTPKVCMFMVIKIRPCRGGDDVALKSSASQAHFAR